MQHAAFVGLFDRLHGHPSRGLEFWVGVGVLVLAVAVELYDFSLVVGFGVEISNEESSEFVGLVVREFVYVLGFYLELYFLLTDFEALAQAFSAG